MKATKKQIADVTAIANEMNVNVSDALNTLSNCSASIYNVIGAKGVVECTQKTANAPVNGDVLFSDCGIVRVSEKAYLLYIPKISAEKWIAKSIIKTDNGNTIIPAWALKN